MSLRLQMLRRACLGRGALSDPEAVIGFLQAAMNADGGFRGRGRASDLYFTVFGIEALIALGAPLPADRIEGFLRGFGRGKGLDFVHLACLARCWADLSDRAPGESVRRAVIAGLEEGRCDDGGYHLMPGRPHGTAYACFLALGAYQDLLAELPQPDGLIRCLASLRTSDGGYANERSVPLGVTPATAAAVAVLRSLGEPVDPAVGDWLLARFGAEGGFRAAPAAAIPDLLSTATALHALAIMGASLEAIRAESLDFVSDLQAPDGSFRAHLLDETGDCEQAFYALLALGHLANSDRDLHPGANLE